jgi:UDP-N-acetyl-D-glucosamine dehydrogenase
MEFCRKGFKVRGFDINRERIASLSQNRSYVLDVPHSEVEAFRSSGLFEADRAFDGLGECDVLLICVQTPLSKSREPDVKNICSAAGEIARRLRKGQLIILESTTFPGTTDELVLPILSKGGRRLGRDFFLAFSPERVDPGNRDYGIANTPKVVGGADALSGTLAAEVYSQIVRQVVPISSTRAAEVVKLLENTFRAVNIALVNEMAQICHHLDLDIWEIIGAASTKPFGFMTFYPGPGIGGHCIPKDPQLLTWKLKALNFEARFIELASRINSSMPSFSVSRISEILNKDRKSLNGSRVLVLGVAYKPEISDYRESPALDVMELLIEGGSKVSYHDPFVAKVKIGALGLSSVPLTPARLKSADCVAILTAHQGLDYTQVARLARRVFDARNVCRGLSGVNLHRL